MEKQIRKANPQSKSALKKAAIAERYAAKARKQQDQDARLAIARAAAAKLTKAMPDGYQDWGVLRTRAYVQLVEIITSKAGNVTMDADRLEGYLAELGRASQWTLEYCQHLSLLHARAANIGAPAEPADIEDHEAMV